jgi:hypothetical protein
MRTLNDYFLTAEIEDVSTASSTFVAVPDGGKIIKIITALQGAISGGNAAITFEIGGTAVTGGGITVAHSGSAAGDVDTAEPTAANRVEEDGTIEMITNGGSTAITGSSSYTGTGTSVGTYEDGYIFVNDVTGEGQMWSIKNHSAAATSGGNPDDTMVINFYDTDKVSTALTTSSQVGLIKNPQNNVEVWDVNDIDGIVAGVPRCDITSGYYFWNQVKGAAAVLTNGTVVLGKNVMTGSTTDGSVDVVADDSSAEFILGGVIAVGATTEYSGVWLNIGA